MKTPRNWMTAILKIDSQTARLGEHYIVLGYTKSGKPIFKLPNKTNRLVKS